jgi:hypothetical protein
MSAAEDRASLVSGKLFRLIRRGTGDVAHAVRVSDLPRTKSEGVKALCGSWIDPSETVSIATARRCQTCMAVIGNGEIVGKGTGR